MTGWRPNTCANEARAVKCAGSGFWERGLAEHVASCPVCSEAVSVARLLNRLRTEDETSARVPDAALMWRKAQFLAARDAGERATQPINFVERFAYALALVCIAAISVWQWHAIRGWFAVAGRQGARIASAFMSGLAGHFGCILDQSSLGIALGRSVIFIASGIGVLILCAVLAAYVARSDA
jgi:hypothetical protein